ncbi:MAG: acyltransferase [Pseudomonadota bacterium]
MSYIIGFGAYRYALALLVVLHHLRLWVPLAETVDWGVHAVLSFFVISGYMIARILDKSYSGDHRKLRFLLNRALRLLPAHWATLVFLLFTFFVVPDAMLGWGLGKGATNPLDTFSVFNWIENFLLVGNAHLANFPTWTIRLELYLYLVALLLFPMHRYVVVGCLLVGLCASMTWPLAALAAYPPYSVGLLASLFPFSAGACAYHFRAKIPQFSTFSCYAATSVSLLFIVGLKVWGLAVETSALISVFMTTAAVVILQSRRQHTAPRCYRIDEFLGDMSYTVYLIHKPVMIWIGWIAMTGSLFTTTSVWFVFAMMAMSHLLGLAVNRVVERPVKVVRAKIRKRKIVLSEKEKGVASQI